MRIAQAYGLGEFAQELKGLQDDDASGSGEVKTGPEVSGKRKRKADGGEEGDEVDEQEEWNREVEEDWRRQEEALKGKKEGDSGQGMKINLVIKEEGPLQNTSGSS